MSRLARVAGVVTVEEVRGFSLHKINVFILSVSYRYGYRYRIMVISRCRGVSSLQYLFAGLCFCWLPIFVDSLASWENPFPLYCLIVTVIPCAPVGE